MSCGKIFFVVYLCLLKMEEPKNDRVHSILDILLEPHRLDEHVRDLSEENKIDFITLII